jgi:DNA-binding transcriptional LysR family regulator
MPASLPARIPRTGRRVATEMTNLDSTLEPGNGDELLQAVRAERLDAAVVSLPAPRAGLRITPLGREPPGGCVPVSETESAPCPANGRSAPPTGADLGPDSISALVVSAAAGPHATAREPDDVVGARNGHGPVRLTGRRGERRLARVDTAGEGGLGDDRPRRPVSRTRQ